MNNPVKVNDFTTITDASGNPINIELPEHPLHSPRMGIVNAAIIVSDMSLTQCEHILNDVVTHHVNNESFERTNIFTEESTKIMSNTILDIDTIAQLFFLNWCPLSTTDKPQVQYLTAKDSLNDDVELIVIQSPDGNRTIVTIVTDSIDDDYNGALVSLWHIGTVVSMYCILAQFGIKADNISTWAGDTINYK